ncbi:MAG: right-handed parallel beta-helix repeat-containing protein, partial [Deltaproteobacteria bacterium]|nr:right-handed parallel beta-helix repeat-containing protein [Deltaproteobacteria bacterium]
DIVTRDGLPFDAATDAGLDADLPDGGADGGGSDIASEDTALACQDLDSDGRGTGCPAGEDHCDDDGDNWTIDGCQNCIDLDGDGLGAGCDRGTDCDDRLATCREQCTNSDGDDPVVPDCIEVFCGSDPNDVESVCHLVSSRAEANAAIASANAADGRPDFILLLDMQTDDIFTTISSDDGVTIRQVPGAVLRQTDHTKDILVIDGDRVLLDGLHLSGGKQQIEIKAASATVRHCVLEGFEHRGINVINSASGTLIEHNVFAGGTGDQDNRAAVYTDSGHDITIAGNLFVACNTGIVLKNAHDLFIDHNTFASNIYRGIRFYSNDSGPLCLRSNIFSGHAVTAVEFEHAAIWDSSQSCIGPLDSDGSGPRFGNAAFGNSALCTGGCAAGGDCASCLPAGTPFEFDVDPLYATTTLGHVGFYCPIAVELIDSGDDLGYDRTPGDDGNVRWLGSGPDIGGRESGTPECGG